MTYVAPSKVFAHLDRLSAWQRGETPAPVTIEWDLSSRCYLGCQSCHFAHTHTKGPWVRKDRRLPMAFESVGDLADVSVVIRGLTEIAAAGVRGVVWSGGGEPTTHPAWTDIVEHAAHVGLQQGMYTAGGLLTQTTAPWLAREVQWVVVSLDACDRETYRTEKGVDGFEAACTAIAAMAATRHTGAVVGVSFLLHEGNWHQALAMLSLARTLGATYATFRPTIETSPDQPAVCTSDREWVSVCEPILREIAKEPDVECDVDRFLAYRDWTGRSYETCHGIKLNATITPDGRVWVCPQRRGMPGSEIGDLRRESFADLWARHPKQWTDFAQCRLMCRLHLLNEQLSPVLRAYQHEAFV